MVQCGCRFCLQLEACERFRVLRKEWRDEFQRHWPAEPDVKSLIHNTHAAASYFFTDPVMHNLCSVFHGDHCSIGPDNLKLIITHLIQPVLSYRNSPSVRFILYPLLKCPGGNESCVVCI